MGACQQALALALGDDAGQCCSVCPTSRGKMRGMRVEAACQRACPSASLTQTFSTATQCNVMISASGLRSSSAPFSGNDAR